MNFDILQILKEYAGVIAASFAFVADMIIAFVVGLNSRLVKRVLNQAKKRDTFTVCPHCHKKIMLSDMSFRLPTGEIDNDLNGKPDSQE